MLSNIFNFIFKKFKVVIIIILVIFFITNYIKGKYSKNVLLETNNFGQKSNISYFDIKEFRRINSDNILLDKKQYNKVSNPIISIVLTNYNQFHCIHK